MIIRHERISALLDAGGKYPSDFIRNGVRREDLRVFLRAANLNPRETDSLRESRLYTTTPPESEGESIAWFRETAGRHSDRSFSESEPFDSKAIRDRSVRYRLEQQNPQS